MSSFQELLNLSGAALRADPGRANALLRDVADEWASRDGEQRDRIVLSALEASLYSGPAALGAGDVAKLVVPLLRLFPSDDELSPYVEALRAVAGRDGMGKSPMLLELLRSRGITPSAASVPLSEADLVAAEPGPVSVETERDAYDFLGQTDLAIPPIGEVPGDTNMRALSQRWRDLRLGTDPLRRHGVDRWMIRSAGLVRQALDVEYCDALRRDDAFWSDPDTSSMVAGLLVPFGGGIGELQAACLNSRLRFLRPRLFLQHPDTLVISPLGSSSHLEEAQEALFEEVSYPFLRSIRRLQIERRRGPAPRVSALDDIDRYLTDVLRRFGLRLLHDAGETVAYDPQNHLSAVDIDSGDPAVVLEPGLVEIASGRVRLQARVTTEASAQAALDGEEDDNV